MAENVSAHAIVANTSEIAEPVAFAQQVASLLGLDASAIEKRIRGASSGSSVLLDKLYPDELTDTLKEQLMLIDGVSIGSEGYGARAIILSAILWPMFWDTLAISTGQTGPSITRDAPARMDCITLIPS